AELAAVGAEDRPGAPAAALHAVLDVPAHIPVRDDLEPAAGRGAGVAGAPAPVPPAQRVRPVRRGLFGLPTVRGDAPDRLLEPHPRDAAQLLDRAAAVPGCADVVRCDPTRLEAPDCQAPPAPGSSAPRVAVAQGRT